MAFLSTKRSKNSWYLVGTLAVIDSQEDCEGLTVDSVDSEVAQSMLLILNQLQSKNRSVGLKERLSLVYQALTMTQ